jgi:hypothetical protein
MPSLPSLKRIQSLFSFTHTPTIDIPPPSEFQNELQSVEAKTPDPILVELDQEYKAALTARIIAKEQGRPIAEKLAYQQARELKKKINRRKEQLGLTPTKKRAIRRAQSLFF